MPPKKRYTHTDDEQETNTAQTSDGIHGKLADPEYVSGYQVGHADGREVGLAEGRAAGLKEAGDVDGLLAVAKGEGYVLGFQAGYAAAKVELKPPLFEASKLAAESHWRAADDEINEAIGALEEEYGERLSWPDRNLVWAIVRRHRLAARAQQGAETARPRSPVGRRVQAEGPRAETVYEKVG